ncbi:DUF4355 domain-containing protein [Heyndrickxia sporothermodurans]|uniref:DUF4355 domain-containing protein n=1 Tax=Heyndrickxia sporothermodurans TaxID=46224 RepID=A0AB37HB86_9BACI|nr:DUF4355 domain-containing protein [Heyndrickxia sporothermodurans]MBL5768405.1 DUF4355 domain-containing protein [Heyndrickxia sporothermodurans]MBL5771030.1 DUF4355 domain-containing protein [Heyndrickxia sporothermodurans]MBL5774674.1 DUF4355 domain-containing protein [Heyndrickxia sporothermodurans]MBL5778132.1 DUF4355 domain-containing protein [Heyndrickxia sporothermodurans]MBL5785405.1 DUF4355 domain-containing protein [Heyndrickxia sporothermodurans]
MPINQITNTPKFFTPKSPLRLDIQFFSDGGQGGNGGGGTPPPAEPPAGGGNPTPPANPEPPKLTLDLVQSFVNDNEDAKKWLQSLTDTRVTDAIKTYETKTLPKKLEEEIAKRYPAETEEQKQLRELKQQFERLETEKQRETLRNKALSVATEKQLPTKLVDFFVGQDEESTLKNLGTFEEIFSAAVQQAVEGKFKAGGREPQPSGLSTGIDAQIEEAKKRAMETGRQEDRVAYAALKMKKETQGK